MKCAIVLFSMTIFFTSHGMDNFIKSVICVAPPYIISEIESSEDNYRQECESIKTMWRCCQCYKNWLVSYVSSRNTTKIVVPQDSISDVLS